MLSFLTHIFFILTENKSKRELIRMLVQKGYESDPVAAWSKAQEKVLLQRLGHTSTHTNSRSNNMTKSKKSLGSTSSSSSSSGFGCNLCYNS